MDDFLLNFGGGGGKMFVFFQNGGGQPDLKYFSPIFFNFFLGNVDGSAKFVQEFVDWRGYGCW